MSSIIHELEASNMREWERPGISREEFEGVTRAWKDKLNGI